MKGIAWCLLVAGSFCACLHLARAQSKSVTSANLPAKLKLSIGNPHGTVYTVELVEGALRYGVDRSGDELRYKTVKPSAQAWAEFWKSLDRLKVWKWRPDYGSANVLHSKGWEIIIEQGWKRGKAVTSRGEGVFPSDADPKKPTTFGDPGEHPSRIFQGFAEAVRKLLNGEEFR